MTRGRMLAVALGLALAAAVLIALHGRPGAREARPAAAVPAPQATAPAKRGITAPPQRPSEPAPAGPRATRDAGTSDATQVMRATDTHDRALLADIERQTHASPPEAVYALIELRRTGATREELQRVIDRDLAGRLPVRVAASRWLRTVLPRPGLGPEPAEPPPMGRGGGPKLLGPIEPVREGRR